MGNIRLWDRVRTRDGRKALVVEGSNRGPDGQIGVFLTVAFEDGTEETGEVTPEGGWLTLIGDRSS